MLGEHLHSNHYLLILAKRHLIGMYGLNLSNETKENLELRERLCREVCALSFYNCISDVNMHILSKAKCYLPIKLFFQVLNVLNIIEPGLNYERSCILRDLATTKKLVLQRKLLAGEITEVEFTIQVQECVTLFNEHQECILMRLKKPPDFEREKAKNNSESVNN